jgi:sugar-specific transcriptional regulator TrmB
MAKTTDNKLDKGLQDKLISFGLTDKEALIYMVLLSRKDVGVSKLSQASGIHRQLIYNALDGLERLGLANHAIQNGRKKFNAVTPTRLVSLIDEKKLDVQAVSKELQTHFAGVYDQAFEVYQGDSAFMAHQVELIKNAPDGTVLDVISGPNELYGETFRKLGYWDEYHRIRKEKNLLLRYLGAESQREWLKGREVTETPFEYRVLPGHAIGKMSIEIRSDNITFASYGKVLLDFTLYNKEIAESYREFFNTLWQTAKR